MWNAVGIFLWCKKNYTIPKLLVVRCRIRLTALTWTFSVQHGLKFNYQCAHVTCFHHWSEGWGLCKLRWCLFLTLVCKLNLYPLKSKVTTNCGKVRGIISLLICIIIIISILRSFNLDHFPQQLYLYVSVQYSFLVAFKVAQCLDTECH